MDFFGFSISESEEILSIGRDGDGHLVSLVVIFRSFVDDVVDEAELDEDEEDDDELDEDRDRLDLAW